MLQARIITVLWWPTWLNRVLSGYMPTPASCASEPFYHDIGKTARPPFFTENQDGINPHDSLSPESSARIIINHVSDGLEMARQHRLPQRIQDFIAEHHGSRVVWGFYRKAVEEVGGDESRVDMERFQYPGPRPQTRETAIVMLSDAIDATAVAIRPNTEAGIIALVSKTIDDHVQENQLNDSGLTLGDIQRLRESFIETLKGRFHVRVRYPGNEELVAAANEAQTIPAVSSSDEVLADSEPAEPELVLSDRQESDMVDSSDVSESIANGQEAPSAESLTGDNSDEPELPLVGDTT